MKPVRIQLSRRKGWRMPPNTVKVTRPGIWGNPFIVSPKARPGSRSGAQYICLPTAADAVECFHLMVLNPARAQWLALAKKELGGKNLACWCPVGSPCHADILLRLVNTP